MARVVQTPDNRCMPLEEWPFQDREAWLAALQPTGFLESGGVAAGWAEGGRAMVIAGYGRWLTWLTRTGRLGSANVPADRVTRETVAAYAEALAAVNAPMTVQARINQLGRAMRALAPDQDWGWVLRAADRLRAVAKPVRDKRGRLQTINALAELGISMMERAHTSDPYFETQRAVLFRDGLIVALLAHRPLRMRTFAAIEIGKNLVQRAGCWWLIFDPSDTKTKKAIVMPWPAQLVTHLEDYLAIYRPALMDRPGRRGMAPTSGLWVTKGGKMMGKAAIQHQITDHTRRAFGKPISPHLFRDAAATTIAVDAPTDVHVIPDILSHTSLKTSERHYNQAGSLEASGRYQSFLKQTRKL